MKIRAALIKEPNSLYVIEEIDLEEPHADEMLVKVAASGYCRTDELIRTQAMPVRLPAVLGHEGCGIVEKVGTDVREFKPGDRVAFSYGSCGKCASCTEGKPTLCDMFETINFGGVQADGTSRLSQNGMSIPTLFGQSSFAEYAVVNERGAVMIPDDVPLEITGPLGCGIQTGAGAVLNRLKPRPGSAIAVFGCGGVGLSAVMAAKISNCGTIVAVDRVQSRLEMALELGATHVVNTSATPDAPAEIKKITGRGADCSVDASGNDVCLKMALNCTRSGSPTVVVGGGGDAVLNVEMDIMGHAKSLLGVVEGDSVPKLFIPELLRHYKAGRFPFDKLITYYDFDDINTAMLESTGGKAIKAVLRMK
ncbi:MAG: NAD(P)-dependent alcohol dehydrogenase [Oscillospiraceae bacterium]|nr:NAD(P)-dependent alcohol dehydrogenase [Oscillospiraceae bacterium]